MTQGFRMNEENAHGPQGATIGNPSDEIPKRTADLRNRVVHKLHRNTTTVVLDGNLLHGRTGVKKKLEMVSPGDVPVSFDTVSDKNIKQLRRLNLAIFPMQYQDNFYTDALSSGDFTKLAYYGDLCVGSLASML